MTHLIIRLSHNLYNKVDIVFASVIGSTTRFYNVEIVVTSLFAVLIWVHRYRVGIAEVLHDIMIKFVKLWSIEMDYIDSYDGLIVLR